MELAKNLGIEQQVVFHGALFGLSKFQTLQGFDVFLHTSRMEGFPMAVLEAAALRLPCLTSEATNINSYIQEFEAGFPLQENNPTQIALAMIEVQAKHIANHLPQLGQQARRMVEECFNWTTIAKQLIEIYQSSMPAIKQSINQTIITTI